jgi:hypothetical protein
MDAVFTFHRSHRCEKLKEAMHFVSISLRVQWRYFAEMLVTKGEAIF